MTMTLAERLEKKLKKFEERIELLKEKAKVATAERKLYYFNKINQAYLEVLKTKDKIKKELEYYKK